MWAMWMCFTYYRRITNSGLCEVPDLLNTTTIKSHASLTHEWGRGTLIYDKNKLSPPRLEVARDNT